MSETKWLQACKRASVLSRSLQVDAVRICTLQCRTKSRTKQVDGSATGCNVVDSYVVK